MRYPDAPRRPLSALVTASKAARCLCLDAEAANRALAPLVHELPADQELERLLSRFGWCQSLKGFTRTLDIGTFTASLQMHNYIKGSVIGRGAYGSVHRAVHRETNTLCAIKQIRVTEYGLCESTLREISTLSALDHQNIVKLREVIAAVSGRHCYLVLELLECDLLTYLQARGGPIELPHVKSIMFQLLSGLRHAHSRCCMHRDIKPQNILLGAGAGKGEARRLQVKIADFGLARGYLPGDTAAYTDWVVTLLYRAPELLLGARTYGPGVDVWSAGCVMAELLNSAPLFGGDAEIALLKDMFGKLGTPTAECWPELPTLANFSEELPRRRAQPLQQLVPRLACDTHGVSLLAGMLSYDPARRLTAAQALQSPWFDDIRAAELQAAADAADVAPGI